jgi:hypothetical protein
LGKEIGEREEEHEEREEREEEHEEREEREEEQEEREEDNGGGDVQLEGRLEWSCGRALERE